MDSIDELNGLIRSYNQNKESLDNYKKIAEEQGTKIKDIMKENNLNEFTTLDGLTAKLIIQKREAFLDTKLIAKLKDLGVTSPIKMVEVVDYDELENVIYNHQLDASELTDCKQIKEVPTLKIKEARHG